MEHIPYPSDSVQPALPRSVQEAGARVVARESRHPWRRSLTDARLIVAVPATRSASPFSRLDLSGVTLGVFPHHD